MYRYTQKYPNTLWPMEGNSLNLVLTWLLSIKFNEIYVCYPNAQYNSFRKCVYIAETAQTLGHTKE